MIMRTQPWLWTVLHAEPVNATILYILSCPRRASNFDALVRLAAVCCFSTPPRPNTETITIIMFSTGTFAYAAPGRPLLFTPWPKPA